MRQNPKILDLVLAIALLIAAAITFARRLLAQVETSLTAEEEQFRIHHVAALDRISVRHLPYQVIESAPGRAMHCCKDTTVENFFILAARAADV